MCILVGWDTPNVCEMNAHEWVWMHSECTQDAECTRMHTNAGAATPKIMLRMQVAAWDAMNACECTFFYECMWMPFAKLDACECRIARMCKNAIECDWIHLNAYVTAHAQKCAVNAAGKELHAFREKTTRHPQLSFLSFAHQHRKFRKKIAKVPHT